MRFDLQNVVDFLNDTVGFTDSRILDQLAATGVEYGVTIPKPVVIEPNFVKAKQYPFISVLPARTTYNSDFGNPAYRRKHEINIMAGYMGLDYKEVTTIIEAYAQAISFLVLQDPTLKTRVTHLELREVDYNTVVENPKNGMLLMAIQMSATINPLPRADERQITT